MAEKSGKKIELEVGDASLTFRVSLEDYHNYQNAFMPDNKVAPSANFLKRTVESGSKDTLQGYLDQGLTVELASAVASEFKPDLEIRVKK